MGHCAVSPSLLLKYFKEKNVRRPRLSTILTTSWTNHPSLVVTNDQW